MPPGEATYCTSWKYCEGIVPELVAMIDFARYDPQNSIPKAFYGIML
jgi:hypothetical protein